MTKIIYFSFKLLTSEEVLKPFFFLKNNKGLLRYTVTVKIRKMFSESFLRYFTGIIDHAIVTSSFPDKLEFTEVMSAFKKDDSLNKQNYRPISLVSRASKIFKRYFSAKSITR